MNPHHVSAQDWAAIYASGGWRCSGSGPGSRLAVNGKLINFLKKLIMDRQIHSLFDVRCGDLQWMSRVIHHLESYTGIDFVPSVIERNKKKFPQHEFLVWDLLRQPLPRLTCDLLVCKDLVHHLVPHQELLLSRIEDVNARYKLIVIPDIPMLASFRHMLAATGWVKKLEYLADENKVLYGKSNGADERVSADSQCVGYGFGSAAASKVDQVLQSPNPGACDCGG